MEGRRKDRREVHTGRMRGGEYVGNTEREITRGRLGGEDMTEKDGREVFRSVNMMGI